MVVSSRSTVVLKEPVCLGSGFDRQLNDPVKDHPDGVRDREERTNLGDYVRCTTMV